MRRALIVPAVVLAAAAPAPDGAQGEVRAALAASVAGWNAGDLDRFVAVYAVDAIFVSSKGVASGRAAIADRYRPSFVGGTNLRGRLAIDPVALRTLSKVHQLLWAKWTLSAADKVESGYTSLVFERRPEGWRIISDHSS